MESFIESMTAMNQPMMSNSACCCCADVVLQVGGTAAAMPRIVVHYIARAANNVVWNSHPSAAPCTY
jgi:hypothetical protein